MQTQRSVEKEGEEVVQALECRFPAAMVQTLVLAKFVEDSVSWDRLYTGIKSRCFCVNSSRNNL